MAVKLVVWWYQEHMVIVVAIVASMTSRLSTFSRPYVGRSNILEFYTRSEMVSIYKKTR